MSSSKQFEVKERYDGTPGWGVYPVGERSNWIAHLQHKEHADRLCAMLNDTNFETLQIGDFEYQTDADNNQWTPDNVLSIIITVMFLYWLFIKD